MNELLIFDRWACEPNCRIQVWRLPNGDIKIRFVDINDAAPLAVLTLTEYRAHDLLVALGGQ